MSISKMAVNKPTTILIIFVVLGLLGIYATTQLPIDLMPDMEIPYVAVSTTYAGAGPEEVEQSVTRVLESSLSSVTGIKTLHSTSSTGNSLVFLELNFGTNLDTAVNEMRDRIDMVRRYLPDDAETPLMFKLDPSMMPIMALVLQGSRTPEELRDYAEDIIQPRLEQLDGVASVSINGGREKAIRIDIPRDRLEAYSLTITQIQQMIGAQNVQSSGGTISEGDKDYTIRTSGQYKTLEDIRDTVISYKVETQSGAMPVTRTIRLRDIADVYDGYKTVSSLAFMDGEPSVMMMVQKQSGKNSVQTSDRVQKQLVEIKKALPGDVTMSVGFDSTDMIRSSINAVVSNLLQGAVLAVLILFIFLRSVKSTLIIGITIPLSLVITLTLMYFAGFSLNLMTLAGLALGVGMLVDNSIVILENIYSYRERGAKATVASVLGSNEMIMAITASTLTTICVFLPMILMQSRLGIIGQLFNSLAFTIVFSLLCSLVTAVVLVPVLSSKYLKIEKVAGRQYAGFLGKVDGAMARFFDRLDNGYASWVRWVLHNKKKFVGALATLFVASILLVVTGAVRFVFMPSQASDEVVIDITMPKGTRLEVTEAMAHQIGALAKSEVNGIKNLRINVAGGNFLSSGSSSTASVNIGLYTFKERANTEYDDEDTVKDKMRAHFNNFPGVTLAFGSSGMGMGGGGASGVDVVIKSDDLNAARATANTILALLKDKGADYVTEPKSSLEDGLPQVDIVVDRERMYNLGLNVYGIGNEIRANINGVTAGRFQTAGDEIDIVAGLDERDRTHLGDLETIFVNSSAGQRVPLANFAAYRESTSPVAISRENQSRVIHVTGAPKRGVSISKVQAEVERLINANIPHDDAVRITYAGDNADLIEGLTNFAIIIAMAIILVFAVMASQFESFKDPFIVLFCIPLSFIGIVTLYLITGETLSVITAVGLLILVGVIVNNGIVLVDYTNLLRKRGVPLLEACEAAAKNRLRPILMTTFTTVLGLVPMAFFPGDGAAMTQPIGQTVLGGLTFGTLMTLFLMPALYAIFNKKSEAKRLRLQEAERKEALNG